VLYLRKLAFQIVVGREATSTTSLRAGVGVVKHRGCDDHSGRFHYVEVE
jgi:hypothetical protein